MPPQNPKRIPRAECKEGKTMMMIDSLNGITPGVTPNVKLDKKVDPEKPKPVESSEESRDPHLVIDKDRQTNRRRAITDATDERHRGPATYSSRGDLRDRPSSPDLRPAARIPIDLSI